LRLALRAAIIGLNEMVEPDAAAKTGFDLTAGGGPFALTGALPPAV